MNFYQMEFTEQKQLSLQEKLQKTAMALHHADAIVIGAGAGLSAAAGFTYSGERFDRYFFDFKRRFGITDIYSGGFYPFPDEETKWAWWSRHIYCNRYVTPPKPVYYGLLDLVRDKNYFVLTTNVDHCFQKAGFDKRRLFYTQGDYGLWQCSEPCHQATYDNEETVRKMIEAQGFVIASDGALTIPEGAALKMKVPTELIPRCPVCGKPMSMNLRSDHTFVEDEGWHKASAAYSAFLRKHENDRVLYWELGVGANTPGIIKFPFWQMTEKNQKACYLCMNLNEAFCPLEIEDRSVCINDDILTTLERLKTT